MPRCRRWAPVTVDEVDVDDVCDVNEIHWSWCRWCSWWMWRRSSWCRWSRGCKGCRICYVDEVKSWNWQQFFGKNPSQELSGKISTSKNTVWLGMTWDVPERYINYPCLCQKDRPWEGLFWPHQSLFRPRSPCWGVLIPNPDRNFDLQTWQGACKPGRKGKTIRWCCPQAHGTVDSNSQTLNLPNHTKK